MHLVRCPTGIHRFVFRYGPEMIVALIVPECKKSSVMVMTLNVVSQYLLT